MGAGAAVVNEGTVVGVANEEVVSAPSAGANGSKGGASSPESGPSGSSGNGGNEVGNGVVIRGCKKSTEFSVRKAFIKKLN